MILIIITISGENVKLVCLSGGYPTPTMTWSRDHQPFQPNQIENILKSHLSSMNQGEDGSRTRKKRALQEAGFYSKSLIALAKSITKEHAVGPAIAHNPFLWDANTKLTKYAGKEKEVMEGVAILKEASFESGGIYTCESKNDAGTVRADINLQIHPKPNPPCTYL